MLNSLILVVELNFFSSSLLILSSPGMDILPEWRVPSKYFILLELSELLYRPCNCWRYTNYSIFLMHFFFCSFIKSFQWNSPSYLKYSEIVVYLITVNYYMHLLHLCLCASQPRNKGYANIFSSIMFEVVRHKNQ